SPQRGPGLHLGGAFSTLLCSPPLGRAPHAVHPRAGLEDEVDEALGLRPGAPGTDAVLARRPRGVTVQRTDAAVDGRGPAGSRGAFEQEQAARGERREVHLELLGERPDRREAQAVQLHQALRSATATASTAARSTSDSPSLASRPVTCRTKSTTTLTGSLAAVT